jgi:hypothetical protein
MDKRILSSFFIGLIFGLGLVVSQMINPQKIVGFLDVAGNWDPSLLVVMAAALVTTFAGYRLVLSRPKPVFESGFQLPAKTVGGIAPWAFVAAMLAGMWAQRLVKV